MFGSLTFVNIFKGFRSPNMLLYIIFQDCSLRRTCCKYFWGVADCTHHGSHFIQLWCTYAGTFLKHGQIVTPGAIYARAWVYFMTTLLCRDLFSLNMFGLLYTPGKFNASMLSDLAISRGEEEIEKSDCRLTLCRHCRVVCSGVCKPNLVISSHYFIYWSSVSSEPSYQ